MTGPFADFRGKETIGWRSGHMFRMRSEFKSTRRSISRVLSPRFGTIGSAAIRSLINGSRTRILNLEDIKHYCRVVTALAKTIEIQRQIDELYPDVEKALVKFG